MTDTRESFKKWVDDYKKVSANQTALAWPSETLVRLFKGPYVPGMVGKNFGGQKALEVGCGSGNNLFFLASLGLDLAGTEIDSEIIKITANVLKSRGVSAELRTGTNRQLPFPDAEFDYLVSWNVIHYEDNEADMKAAIVEYARVLRPGGRFFLSTTGPEHAILKDSRPLEAHRYQIGRADDFRKGQVFFYFDSPADIHFYFRPHFNDVRVGRTHDQLMTETLDWWIVTGVKAAL